MNKNFEWSSAKKVIAKYRMTAGDRIIINGGEPTLHPDFKGILQDFYETGAEIILYSNGRRLADKNLCSYIMERVTRIVIPLHGSQTVHDEITQVKGAFFDTMNALKIIAQGQYKYKLEIKFIVTTQMIQSDFSISEFLKENCLFHNSIVISGTVRTKVAQLNPIILPNINEAGRYIGTTIEELLKSENNIKLIDFPICALPEAIIFIIDNLCNTSKNFKYSYYFFDSNISNGKSLKYDSAKSDLKCMKCTRKQFCTSILDSCRVLNFNSKEKNIILE